MRNFALFSAKKYAGLMLVMLCSFVGVGFVSGAEIYEFFVRFSPYSFAGIFVFFMLCFLLTYKIICFATINRKAAMLMGENIEQGHYKNYVKMQNYAINNDKNTFKYKIIIRNIIVFLNVLFISGAMFSGLKNLLLNLYFDNYFILLIITFFASFFVTLFGVKGLEKIDVLVLVFVGFIMTCFMCDESFVLKTIFGTKATNGSAGFVDIFGMMLLSIFFACLYVFMNIVQFQPLVEGSGISFTKKRAKIFSLIFATQLTAILVIFVLFLNANIKLSQSSMPFLTFFMGKGRIFSKIFAFGLLSCLVSTLVTCLIGVKNNLITFFKKSNFIATVLAVCFAMIISIIPFKLYVSIIYPILGAINFVIFVLN